MAKIIKIEERIIVQNYAQMNLALIQREVIITEFEQKGEAGTDQKKISLIEEIKGLIERGYEMVKTKAKLSGIWSLVELIADKIRLLMSQM